MTARTWTLTLTGPRFSANDRLHFRQRDQLVKTWRTLGEVHARKLYLPQPLQRAHVVVMQVPHNAGRVDPGNVAPAAKAAIDGIVRAGMLADDDAKHMLGPDYRLASEPIRQLPGMWTLRIAITEVAE